ncbi:arylsulfotransferase family protein [Nakamurella alba]|uniref:arylsulfotransferase family protein n=1 Tax=Nakamurella alba TaxID=2665158 RepID=UPI0018AA9AC8|nr:arylsulfotransferase family protein [Nakamurella alba]
MTSRSRPRRALGPILALALLAPLLPVVTATAAGAAPIPTAASAAPGSAVAIPAAGSFTASPQTSISLRDLPAGALPTVSVTGSVSGPHIGKVTAHPDGTGATFTPATAFTKGETVTVSTDAQVAGAENGSYSFTVASPGTHPGITAAGELNTGGATTGPRTQAGTQAIVSQYQTRPDLAAPAVQVNQNPQGTGVAPGYLFATPQGTANSLPGVMMYDNAGALVWFHPVTDKIVGDAEVQNYLGQEVITWFEGTAPYGAGNYRGDYQIYNSAYQSIATVRMGNGYQADIHDMILTEDNTALLMAYNPVLCDNITVTGCKTGATVLDGVIQEVDVATGAVLFEFHSLDHIPTSDTYYPNYLQSNLMDYIHFNSLDIDTDGNIIASARLTSALYKINRTTGDVIWIFGGKSTDFPTVVDDDPEVVATGITGPDYPHDFRVRGTNQYSYFDNGVRRQIAVTSNTSRAAFVTLNPGTGTATYTESLRRANTYGPTQGKNQDVGSGLASLVGWGGLGIATEYNSAGTAIWDANIVGDGTYRTVRQEWTGTPTEKPTVVVSARTGSNATLKVSWNGSTETTGWRVLSGSNPRALSVLGSTTSKSGFETTVTVTGAGRYLAIQAMDGGTPISGGTSEVISGGGAYFEDIATTAVNGVGYQPIVGDFGGASGDDILWYSPSGQDYLHLSNGAGGFTSYPVTINGSYTPVVGDFVGDRTEEILFRRNGSGTAFMWRFDRDDRVFQSASIDIPSVVTQAIVMDNRAAYGGGRDEILYYAAGAAPDRVDRYSWNAGQPLTRATRGLSINGTYTPVTGDFDGNGQGDVLWYAPGAEPDSIWFTSGNSGGSTGYRTVPVSINGTYSARVGNFDGDPDRDEILFYAPGAAADSVWSFAANGSYRSTDVTNSATGAAYVLEGPTDSVMIRNGGAAPQIWSFTGGVSAVSPSGNTGKAVGYIPLIGAFIGAGDISSVFWYGPGSAAERMYISPNARGAALG